MLFDYQDVPQTSAAQWLADHAGAGDRIGYDPWLHTSGWVDSDRDSCWRPRAPNWWRWRATRSMRIWTGSPGAEPGAARSPFGRTRRAQTSAAKRAEIAVGLKARGADAVVIAALDSIAWLLNIRGRDVSRTPVALAFAIVHADASVDLFTAPEKLSDEVRAHLGADVRVLPRDDFEAALGGFGGKVVVADPASCVAAIFAGAEGRRRHGRRGA